MKLLLQRVSEARVDVGTETTGRIGRGILVFLGLEKGDDAAVVEEGARKLAGLRIFGDEDGKMNRAIAEVGGAVLAVSQFTLVADLSRGRRPGFDRALPPEEAKALYEHFVRVLSILGLPVQTGSFGETMKVSLVNEGPATFWMDVRPREAPPG